VGDHGEGTGHNRFHGQRRGGPRNMQTVRLWPWPPRAAACGGPPNSRPAHARNNVGAGVRVPVGRLFPKPGRGKVRRRAPEGRCSRGRTAGPWRRFPRETPDRFPVPWGQTRVHRRAGPRQDSRHWPRKRFLAGRGDTIEHPGLPRAKGAGSTVSQARKHNRPEPRSVNGGGVRRLRDECGFCRGPWCSRATGSAPQWSRGPPSSRFGPGLPGRQPKEERHPPGGWARNFGVKPIRSFRREGQWGPGAYGPRAVEFDARFEPGLTRRGPRAPGGAGRAPEGPPEIPAPSRGFPVHRQRTSPADPKTGFHGPGAQHSRALGGKGPRCARWGAPRPSASEDFGMFRGRRAPKCPSGVLCSGGNVRRGKATPGGLGAPERVPLGPGPPQTTRPAVFSPWWIENRPIESGQFGALLCESRRVCVG